MTQIANEIWTIFHGHHQEMLKNLPVCTFSDYKNKKRKMKCLTTNGDKNLKKFGRIG